MASYDYKCVQCSTVVELSYPMNTSPIYIQSCECGGALKSNLPLQALFSKVQASIRRIKIRLDLCCPMCYHIYESTSRRAFRNLTIESFWLWRNLVARVLWVHEVAGSNPVSQTMNDKAISGLVSEAQALTRCLQLGIVVSVPFGNIARYDLLAEFELNVFSRLQVKTGRYDAELGIITTKLYSTDATSRIHFKYNKSEIDYFIVYCPELDKLYKLPVEEFSTNTLSLRVKETINNQKARVKWAKDYEF